MRTAGVLFVLAALVVGALWWRPRDEAPPPELVAEEPVPEWTGSATCAECHPAMHERWRATTHARTLNDFSQEVVARPFDGEYFTTRDIEHQLGPGATMLCEGPGDTRQRFDVDLVIGVRRVQMFTTPPSPEDGRIQVLPVFLEVEDRRWFDYADFIFGGPTDLRIEPDGPNSWYTFARNFNSRCAVCHTTNFDVGYDADTGKYETTWSERSVSCEACHGAGGAHVRRWRRGGEGEETIVNPARLSIERANQVCGQCHAEGTLVDPGYRPGDDLFAFVDVAGLEDEKHLHPDGRARELIHNLVPTMESRCGPIACTKCHAAHGHDTPGDLYRPLHDDRTCTQCHEEIGNNLEAHTHHPAASAGSRCVECHMPRMVIEGGHGAVRDHTMSIPSIRNTRDFGLPNACRDCHRLEQTGWEYEHFERWYPEADQRNHRVALAAALGKKAREPLEQLLNHAEPVYRAGAAHALARFPTDLRPLLDDPHPLVRRAAIPGLAARAPDALVPLLDDENAVLRFRAAMALAYAPLVRAQPELRERVLAVVEHFARLRSDRDEIHRAAGYLHDLAKRYPEAIRSYERALRLFRWDEPTKRRVKRLRAFLDR